MAIESIPTFETERLILKSINMQDEPCYKKNFIDYEVIRHLSSAVPWPYPEDGVKTYFETVLLPNQGKGRWSWGIFLKSQPSEVIGLVDLWEKGRPEHRGFWLARRFWGQGYMSEAVTPITRYAFEMLGFEKLIFSNALGNIASRRVKEKAGAKFLRTEPAQFVDPSYTEHELWELTKKHWQENQ